jgi:hypothetical protein
VMNCSQKAVGQASGITTPVSNPHPGTAKAI